MKKITKNKNKVDPITIWLKKIFKEMDKLFDEINEKLPENEKIYRKEIKDD